MNYKKKIIYLLKIFILLVLELILMNKFNSNEIKSIFNNISNNTTDLHPNSNIIKIENRIYSILLLFL